MLCTTQKSVQKKEGLGVIFLERTTRDVIDHSQAAEGTPPCSGMSVLTQVNEPWLSWICVVWLNQRSKRNCKNLLCLPGRRTSPSYLSQLKQNKEITVHCGNYSEIFEHKNEQITFLPGQIEVLEAATVNGDKENQHWFFGKKVGNSL